MRVPRNGILIVLAVILGAAGAWFWTRGGVERADPPSAGAPPSKPATSSERAPSPTGTSVDTPVSSLPAERAPTTPPLASSAPPPRDDSTYYRMVAIIQSLPRSAEHARTISDLHESVVDAPDDPEWARRTEQTLRDFYRENAGDGRFQVTSIACRSSGCEVQGIGPRVERRDPTDDSPPPITRIPADRPVGPLSRPGPVLFVDLGDSTGYIAIYRRSGELQ